MNKYTYIQLTLVAFGGCISIYSCVTIKHINIQVHQKDSNQTSVLFILQGSYMTHKPFICPVGTHVWDVVSELVGLCTMPPPDNPFSLDMRYLQTLSLPERFLVTGALLNFLEMIVVQGSREEPFYDLGEHRAWVTLKDRSLGNLGSKYLERSFVIVLIR